MKAVVQRVSHAEVKIEGAVHGKIDVGFLVLLGVGKNDSEHEADILASKIAGLRVFTDENDKMNLSLENIGGSVLVISNFTLYAENVLRFLRRRAPKLHSRCMNTFAQSLCR